METKNVPKSLKNNGGAMDKWEAQKGRFKNPEFRAQALAIRKAKDAATFRDPQLYLKRLFNAPKKGGSTIKLTCGALERATRRLSEYLDTDAAFQGADGKFNIKEYLSVIESLKKTISFMDTLNSEAAGRYITNITKIENMNVGGSKTGGQIGSVLDIEPTKLSELTGGSNSNG